MGTHTEDCRKREDFYSDIDTITHCIDCGKEIVNRVGEKKQQMCPKHLRLLHADLSDQ